MGNTHHHDNEDDDENITDVPYKKLNKHTNFSQDQIDCLKKRFVEMYPSYTLGGGLTKEEFSRLFGLPPSEITDACFELFDIDDNGIVTFKELIGTLSICSLGTIDQKLHFLFELWDFEEQGYISRKEMETMVRFVTKLAAQLQDNSNESIQKLGSSISILTDPKKVLKETINPIKIFPLDKSPSFSFKDRKDLVTMEVDQIKILVDKLYEEADTKHDGKINFKMFKEWSKKTPQIINFLYIFDNFVQDSIREKPNGKRLSKITEGSSSGATAPRTSYIAKELIEKVKLEELTILQKVGVGGYSNVYLCTHNSLPSYHFALKRIPKEKLVQDKMFRQARSEKKALMKMDHPLILKVYSSFHDKDSVYLLAEFVCGGDLCERLKEKKQFSISATKFYAAELVLVLEYFRKIHFAHRDLKLENILIDSTGHIKVSDFGFSTYLNGGKQYTACGTRNYMAPEVIEASENGYDHSCDLWSLGIMIYEMIVGVTPFYDENRNTIFKNILNNKVNFPEDCHFDHPTKLLINKLLEKKPSQRIGYSDIKELKEHIWFEDIHWEGHLEGDHIIPPFIPILEIEVDEDLKQNGLPKFNVPDNYEKLFTDF